MTFQSRQRYADLVPKGFGVRRNLEFEDFAVFEGLRISVLECFRDSGVKR